MTLIPMLTSKNILYEAYIYKYFFFHLISVYNSFLYTPLYRTKILSVRNKIAVELFYIFGTNHVTSNEMYYCSKKKRCIIVEKRWDEYKKKKKRCNYSFYH